MFHRVMGSRPVMMVTSCHTLSETSTGAPRTGSGWEHTNTHSDVCLRLLECVSVSFFVSLFVSLVSCVWTFIHLLPSLFILFLFFFFVHYVSIYIAMSNGISISEYFIYCWFSFIPFLYFVCQFILFFGFCSRCFIHLLLFWLFVCLCLVFCL